MNCAAVRDTIIGWLKEQLQKSGQGGFVIGISGGVDSALVSTLCAMTGKTTLLLSMPIHQAENQLERANNHMKWLRDNHNSNVTEITVNLTDTFETFRNLLPKGVNEDELAMANTRSRLRMVTLYAYANHNRLLVAGTGNLVEDYGVGFFSKWGDGGVDISPIGGLSKTQVWELAKFVGVSDEIVTAKPTDGLWADNRGDEDAIGATYSELEWAMAYCESHTEDESELTTHVQTPRESQILQIYQLRHAQSRHKMNPIPICKIPQIIL
jgi:NAD+ synthase